MRVVLGVRSPDVPLHGLVGLALVEHQVVECRDGSLVPLQSVIHQHPLVMPCWTKSSSDPFSNAQLRKASLIFCERQHNFAPCSSLLYMLMCQNDLIPRKY